jgi:hypothetical protein
MMTSDRHGPLLKSRPGMLCLAAYGNGARLVSVKDVLASSRSYSASY